MLTKRLATELLRAEPLFYSNLQAELVESMARLVKDDEEQDEGVPLGRSGLSKSYVGGDDGGGGGGGSDAAAKMSLRDRVKSQGQMQLDALRTGGATSVGEALMLNNMGEGGTSSREEKWPASLPSTELATLTCVRQASLRLR
jgi:hypothetical protein